MEFRLQSLGFRVQKILHDPNPKAQTSPKALHSTVFEPQNMSPWSLRASTFYNGEFLESSRFRSSLGHKKHRFSSISKAWYMPKGNMSVLMGLPSMALNPTLYTLYPDPASYPELFSIASQVAEAREVCFGHFEEHLSW